MAPAAGETNVTDGGVSTPVTVHHKVVEIADVSAPAVGVEDDAQHVRASADQGCRPASSFATSASPLCSAPRRHRSHSHRRFRRGRIHRLPGEATRASATCNSR